MRSWHHCAQDGLRTTDFECLEVNVNHDEGVCCVVDVNVGEYFTDGGFFNNTVFAEMI